MKNGPIGACRSGHLFAVPEHVLRDAMRIARHRADAGVRR
ncbi:hypothetical protein BSLA_01r5593 [Burkholderia stabilis]|nr:hypothetical protein BSLA_01r5593 [Burkholderia stabilis]